MSSRLLVLFAAVVVAALGVVLFVLTRGPLPSSLPRPVTPLAPLAPTARVPPSVAISKPDVASTADAAIVTERAAALAHLRSSGVGKEGWDAQATSLFDAIARRSVEVSDVGCFIAGCGAMLTFSSDAAYRRELAALQASDDYHAWTGGKLVTKPEIAGDGRVSIALVLYRPD